RGDRDPHRDARSGEEEGDAQGRFVDEDRVGHLTMLAQRLAVVGQHGHDRVLVPPRGLEGLQDPAELRVGEGHLAVVEMALEPGSVRRRRRVGMVGRAPGVKATFSRTPWTGGYCPVNSVAWAGPVMGTALSTFSNRAPRRPSPSMTGVSAPAYP